VTAGALDQVAAWPATAAVGVVTADGRRLATGPASRVFRWASVTKIVAALATLVAVEEGVIGLDDPAGPPGATVRHLLAHASGLPIDAGAPVAAPGRRRIYSNAGFEAAGTALADASGIPITDYIGEAVLRPLGMTGTTVVSSPAWGASGPLDDLLSFGHELMVPTLVAPETMAAATRVAFPLLDGVLPGFGRQRPNDWGLGFELRDHKSPHWTGSANAPSTFGHFGRSGAFVWVDPTVPLVCAGVADRDFGPWAAEAWPRLADAVLASFDGRAPGA